MNNKERKYFLSPSSLEAIYNANWQKRKGLT